MDIVENLQKFLALLATPPSNLGLLFLYPPKGCLYRTVAVSQTRGWTQSFSISVSVVY